MKKIIKVSFLALILPLITTAKAYAMCPICTLAVGGALVLAEKYGVDNTISGLWFGGLAVSVSAWTNNWLRNKKLYSNFIGVLVYIFYYLSMVIPLYLKKAIGLPTKQLWGVDKVVLGMVIGSIFFFLGDLVYKKMKASNGDKPFFPFQKVVMPVSSLAIMTVIFYFITR